MPGKKWIRPAAVFCSWLVLTGIQCLAGFGFVRPVVLLGLMAGLFLCLVISGLGARRGPQGGWRRVAWFGGVMVLGLVSVPIAAGLSALERRRAIAVAAPLISGAERLHGLHGQYSSAIAGLLPEFLAAEPAPAYLGTAPFQLHSTQESFTVYFEMPEWELCSYDSASRKWTVSD